jgi:multidrug efflux pump subunit AcrA (membrane-fusion protein)
LRIPETQARELRIGQAVAIDTRAVISPGRVTRIDPAVQNGTVAVDVSFDGPLPEGARPDLSVVGTIEIERLENVLHVGRPASGGSNDTISLFKLDADGATAERVSVTLGRSSVTTVEIETGLQVSDRVVLSDTSRWDEFDRIRLE